MSKDINISISKKVFNKVYLSYLDIKERYLIFYGGAGSGKSFFIVERYIYKLLKETLMNLLVVRATGKSNRDSTFALFKQVINKWKLSKYFKINESDLRIKCLLNGNEIIFSGLDDVEKLKSITFSKGELTDVWIEEASEILEADFNQLDVRLRGKGTKKQIVISFNPIDINHWLKKKFFDIPRDNVVICHTTYKDNEFLDDDYKKLLESYKYTDEYYYNVYCLGQWGVLGKTVFDARAVSKRLLELPKPLKIGYFEYKYDDTKPGNKKISDIKWINDKNGYIEIYETPNIYQYCIGGDTAGEGSDWFTGHVLNAKTGKQVARLRHQMDEDLYVRQMYCLGYHYKHQNTKTGIITPALMCIESNFSSYPNKELVRLGYPNLFVREKEDRFSGVMDKSYGFRTTSVTRPVIIAELVKIVRESVELINDKLTLEEMLTFVRNEKGRPEAQQGAHDDLVMGLAIAYYSRNQVIFDVEPVTIKQVFNFDSEYQEEYDYGEEIVVI